MSAVLLTAAGLGLFASGIMIGMVVERRTSRPAPPPPAISPYTYLSEQIDAWNLRALARTRRTARKGKRR